jgi:hypothetical protein
MRRSGSCSRSSGSAAAITCASGSSRSGSLFFLWELIVSSVRVAWEVITPGDHSRAQIVEMPLDVESDIEILLVTNLISLTPGTLSLDVTPDRRRCSSTRCS